MQRSPAFTIALLLALAIVTLWWQLSEKRARALNTRAVAAEQHAVALEDSMRALRIVGESPRSANAEHGPALISDDQLEQLRALGLPDPRHQLPASLAGHRELIPFKGVNGGTMGFYDEKGILLLDGPWVSAPFDDGHINGYGLFEYSVAPGGRISWKRLAARLPD
jgi:hypothetical protein